MYKSDPSQMYKSDPCQPVAFEVRPLKKNKKKPMRYFVSAVYLSPLKLGQCLNGSPPCALTCCMKDMSQKELAQIET